MARKVFYSFHYKPDIHRASQVRNIGVLEGNQSVSGNEWEAITNAGDQAIKNWIDGQMSGKSCAIVLIGAATANRKWIDYEIKKAWDAKKGLVGVYIHNLKNLSGDQSSKGTNPFSGFTVGADKQRMASIVKAYDPPYSTSTNVYSYIAENVEDWVAEAITIRDNF